MRYEVSIPFQSQIICEDGKIETVGPCSLLEKVHQLKTSYGMDVTLWPLQAVDGPDTMLINELIRQSRNEIFVYNHTELCHCRMVTTEKVKNAVKAGCMTVAEVSRTTLAGTGCGSCRKNIEDIIKALNS